MNKIYGDNGEIKRIENKFDNWVSDTNSEAISKLTSSITEETSTRQNEYNRIKDILDIKETSSGSGKYESSTINTINSRLGSLESDNSNLQSLTSKLNRLFYSGAKATDYIEGVSTIDEDSIQFTDSDGKEYKPQSILEKINSIYGEDSLEKISSTSNGEEKWQFTHNKGRMDKIEDLLEVTEEENGETKAIRLDNIEKNLYGESGSYDDPKKNSIMKRLNDLDRENGRIEKIESFIGSDNEVSVGNRMKKLFEDQEVAKYEGQGIIGDIYNKIEEINNGEEDSIKEIKEIIGTDETENTLKGRISELEGRATSTEEETSSLDTRTETLERKMNSLYGEGTEDKPGRMKTIEDIVFGEETYDLNKKTVSSRLDIIEDEIGNNDKESTIKGRINALEKDDSYIKEQIKLPEELSEEEGIKTIGYQVRDLFGRDYASTRITSNGVETEQFTHIDGRVDILERNLNRLYSQADETILSVKKIQNSLGIDEEITDSSKTVINRLNSIDSKIGNEQDSTTILGEIKGLKDEDISIKDQINLPIELLGEKDTIGKQVRDLFGTNKLSGTRINEDGTESNEYIHTDGRVDKLEDKMNYLYGTNEDSNGRIKEIESFIGFGTEETVRERIYQLFKEKRDSEFKENSLIGDIYNKLHQSNKEEESINSKINLLENKVTLSPDSLEIKIKDLYGEKIKIGTRTNGEDLYEENKGRVSILEDLLQVTKEDPIKSNRLDNLQTLTDKLTRLFYSGTKPSDYYKGDDITEERMTYIDENTRDIKVKSILDKMNELYGEEEIKTKKMTSNGEEWELVHNPGRIDRIEEILGKDENLESESILPRLNNIELSIGYKETETGSGQYESSTLNEMKENILELKLQDDTLIGAIQRGKNIIYPQGKDEIKLNDTVLVICRNNKVKELNDMIK